MRLRARGGTWPVGLLVALVGCPDGGVEPEVCDEDACTCETGLDVPHEPVRDPAVAFDLWRDGVVERHQWRAAAGDVIECRSLDCEPTRLAITLAAASGTPRLELDACGVVGNSLLPPFELERADACTPDDRGFVVRWIDGEQWKSQPSSPACQLNMTVRDGTITGTFECGSLLGLAGASTDTEVRLGTGTFECAVER